MASAVIGGDGEPGARSLRAILIVPPPALAQEKRYVRC